MELTCQSVLEDWIANRKISSEKLSFLELIHKKNLHNLQNICQNICGILNYGHPCKFAWTRRGAVCNSG